LKRTRRLAFLFGLSAILCAPANASNSQPTQLFAFSCTDNRFQDCPQGLEPQALLQASDGNFYGATSRGGSQNLGTIFRVTPSGKFTPLFSFSGTNGSSPGQTMVEAADGNLYGTTEFGGEFSTGVVFKIAKNGSGFRIVHSFEKKFAVEFFFGEYLTLGGDGNIYGSSVGGGLNVAVCQYGCGTIFRINIPSGQFLTIHQLNGISEGSEPSALIQASDGNFYGTAGTNLFRVSSTGKFTVVGSLSALGIPYPGGGGVIQASNGNLFGMMDNVNQALLFEIALDGSGLQAFPEISALQNSITLSKLLQTADGNLWLAQAAILGQNGAIMSLSSRSGLLLQNIPFNLADGSGPMAPLVQGVDGNLYGTTLFGGTPSSGTGAGVVFRFTP
jgi:uncharacterized repeat protein (TIGR03803 family)